MTSGITRTNPQDEKHKPLISLCMIVRDEARFLPACLRSVRDAVDEIVVVDTGSTDETPDIARRFGARVHAFPWSDDFSEARNRSLELATGKWILILDGDESIAGRDTRKIVEMARGDADGYRFTYRSYSQNTRDIRWVANDGSYAEGVEWDGWIPGRVVRMFRRDERIRFQGAVHETVDSSIIRCGGTIAATDIIIHHYHERKGAERLREKQLQYLRLCEKNVRLLPNNPKTYFDMGLIHRHVLNELERAKDLQEQALRINPDYLDARMELALLCHLQNDSPRATRHLGLLLEKNPHYAPAWCLCAIMLEQRGKKERAIECYERALALNSNLVDARINLGTLQAGRGDFRQAREQWTAAHAMNPSNAKALLNLGALELREGRHAEAKAFFERALEASPESAAAWNNLGVVYAGAGQKHRACEAFERALALDPSRNDIRRNLAALSIQAPPPGAAPVVEN